MGLILDTTLIALSALETPPSVVVGGKRLSAPMFFSEAVAEPILYWHANSLASSLHDATIFDLEAVSDPAVLSGVRIRNFNLIANAVGIGSGKHSLGAGVALLLVSEAAEQLLMPARMGVPYDYENLMINFKASVRAGFQPGTILPAADFSLGQALFLSLRQSVSGSPSQSRKASA